MPHTIMASPQLSVLVPSVNGLGDLLGCLAALTQQQSIALEVVVIDRLGEEVRSVVRSRFPDVVVVPTGPDTTIPEMRALGFDQARGDAIAVIEDHVIVPPTWGRALLDALTDGNSVVGGSVENAATETVLDWAAFLCEYSACLPPLPAGEASWLPGNNVVYPRQLVRAYRPVIGEGRWENRLHDAMRADGVRLLCRPEIVVGHKKHYTFGEYLSQRYLYARSYAGTRVQGAPALRRFAFGAAALALPPLLFYRTVSRVVSKRRHLGHLFASLPLLAVFVASWGVGEIVGYWFGAGNALSKVQ
jgi:glycosyltransferase involved in cell wall biosynthesis